MAGGIPAPTVEALKELWMARTFAGPSEKFDTEQEIDAFLAPLKARAEREEAQAERDAKAWARAAERRAALTPSERAAEDAEAERLRSWFQ